MNQSTMNNSRIQRQSYGSNGRTATAPMCTSIPRWVFFNHHCIWSYRDVTLLRLSNKGAYGLCMVRHSYATLRTFDMVCQFPRMGVVCTLIRCTSDVACTLMWVYAYLCGLSTDTSCTSDLLSAPGVCMSATLPAYITLQINGERLSPPTPRPMLSMLTELVEL